MWVVGFSYFNWNHVNCYFWFSHSFPFLIWSLVRREKPLKLRVVPSHGFPFILSWYEHSSKQVKRKRKSNSSNLKTVDRTWRNIFMQCDINQIWRKTNWRKQLEDEVLSYRTYVHTHTLLCEYSDATSRNALFFLPFEKVKLASHSLLRVSIWNFRRWIHSFPTSHDRMHSCWMLPFSWACANSPVHFKLFICKECHYWKLIGNKLIQTIKRKEKTS